jgi:glycosyltransferase involved in cell wall biosynthesis
MQYDDGSSDPRPVVKAPLVSVVMGIYNGARDLARSVESVLAQEGVDFEFIIVDDGSDDGSREMLADYAARDGRVRMIAQENTGLTRALIRGCREARGKYIARQDADDVSSPGRLAALSCFLERHDEAVLVFSWVRILAPGGEVVGQVDPSISTKELTRRLREEMVGIPAHGSVMFRKDAYDRVGGYRQEFYYAQDCDLWLRMAWEGDTGCVHRHLYDLYQTTQSISSSRRKLQGRFARLAVDSYLNRRRQESDGQHLSRAEELRQLAIASKDRAPSRRNAATTYYLMGAGLDEGESPRAAAYYSKAILMWPLSLRFWWGIIAHYVRRRGRA